MVRVSAVLLILLGLLPGLAPAQTREATLQAIARLRGGEREAKLLGGARKEGGLVWYSSADADDALALTQKFQEQYPFLRVEHFRAPSEKVLQRILMESRAKAFKADVISLPEIELNILTKQNLVSRYESPEQDAYPLEMKDPRGYWNGMYISAGGLAYNTKLVPPEGAPRTHRRPPEPPWQGGVAPDPQALF